MDATRCGAGSVQATAQLTETGVLGTTDDGLREDAGCEPISRTARTDAQPEGLKGSMGGCKGHGEGVALPSRPSAHQEGGKAGPSPRPPETSVHDTTDDCGGEGVGCEPATRTARTNA